MLVILNADYFMKDNKIKKKNLKYYFINDQRAILLF
jgi:hypothetical protein